MKCETCFRHCALAEGQIGWCKARQRVKDVIVDRNYGKISALALDPIEKKPLAFFHPGSMILSVGSYGCNLACPFCQNHAIAQRDLDGSCAWVTPEQLVEKAVSLVPHGNIGIAFTYNEPMLSWEFIRDTGRLAKARGLQVVVVTNGSVTLPVLEKVLPYVDAFNIDLKGFSNAYYDYVSGNLETVKRFIERAATDAHVELTTLVVPGKNDSVEEMEALSSFVASISPSIPLHLTRYFPRWKEETPATSIETLQALQAVALRHLDKVVLGNV